MNLELLNIFVKVVQNNSFTKASHTLKLPKSTVSKAITHLEQTTGTKLLVRTTRNLSLTEAGKELFLNCQGPILALEEAQKNLQGKDQAPMGLIKITAPEDLGNKVLAPSIAKITKKYSGLKFELHYTDEVMDLVKSGLDLAIRIGKINESSFKIKKAGFIEMVPVATMKYLKNKKKITEPNDLLEHDCLAYNDQVFSRWTLKSQKKTVQIAINAKVSSNQMTSLINLALNDGGIAFVPKYLCNEEIKEGKLVRVLPEWIGPGLPVSIISPLSFSSTLKLKITVDQIFEDLNLILQK